MEPFILIAGVFLLALGLVIDATWMIAIGGFAVGRELAVLLWAGNWRVCSGESLMGNFEEEFIKQRKQELCDLRTSLKKEGEELGKLSNAANRKFFGRLYFVGIVIFLIVVTMIVYSTEFDGIKKWWTIGLGFLAVEYLALWILARRRKRTI